MPVEQAGLFELGQSPINRGQADIHVFTEQQAIDIVRRQVFSFLPVEKLEDFHPREGGLESYAL